MATIFLLNFAEPFRSSHALTLRARRLTVIVPEEQGQLLSDFRDDEFRQADYVLFDFTSAAQDRLCDLRRICRLQRRDGTPLFVTCISRTYHGPALQLIVEKIGARLVYAN